MADPRTKKKATAAAIAVAIAAPAEGLRQYAYYDPPGILTVCFGHTGSDVVKGKQYSVEQCKALMDADMLSKVEKVDRCAPDSPPSVLAAFSDAAYNIGEAIACDRANSTAARKLYAHDWKGACDELPKWDKARVGGMMISLPGLTKRRAAEREICMSGL